MQELDIRDVFRLLLARIHWLIIATVLGAVLLGGYAALFLPEQYTSTAMVYISNVRPDYDANATTSSNLTSAEKLGKIIRVAAMTETSLQNASLRLDGKLSVGALRGSVAFAQIEETPFMQVAVTNTDPALAREACQVMAEVTVDAFTRTGEVGKAIVFNDAIPASKTSPNVPRNVLIGALAGLVTAITVVALQLFLNSTIRDRADLRTRMDVPVLGEIPSFDLATKGGKK